jgi:hypothetical protein
MRQTIFGLIAAIAVMTAGAVPAMACGGGLFQGSCSPCGQAYVEPCAQPQVYVAPQPVYSGCNSCGGGWGYERLPDPVEQYHSYANPVHQYYYADQGPTYTGPGNFAPRPVYREGEVSEYGYRHHAYGYEGGEGYGYRTHRHFHPWHHYGYGHHHGYGYEHGYAPHHYGYREHVLRRYY